MEAKVKGSNRKKIIPAVSVYRSGYQGRGGVLRCTRQRFVSRPQRPTLRDVQNGVLLVGCGKNMKHCRPQQKFETC